MVRVSTLPGSVLHREALLELIRAEPPLVEGFLDLEAQLQPQGFDLTVAEVAALAGRGRMGATNAERQLPPLDPLPYGHDGYVDLAPGSYLVTINEVVRLPLDVMALGRPRSSLLRCGVDVGTAVWDAGYQGRSQCLLMVHNPAGFRLARNARILQLVFFRLAGAAGQGYSGAYQGENL